MLLFVLFACQSEPAPEAPVPADEPSHADHSPPADHADHAAPQPVEGLLLTLNGTERWPMDEHTREVFAETRSSLATADIGSVEEATALGAVLQGQLDRLIEGCTMDGAAHDELHVFLMVWIPEVSSLQDDTALDVAKARVQRLQAMVTEYDRFFE
jgi:hypothetical protein